MNHPHADGGRPQDAPQLGLVFPQGLLDELELADVRDHPRGTDDLSGMDERPRHEQAGKPRPVFTQKRVLDIVHRVALPHTLCPLARNLMLFRRDDLEEMDAGPDVLFAVAEQFHGRAVGIGEHPVDVRLVDAHGQALDEFAIASLAGQQGLLCLFRFRDVPRVFDHALQFPRVVIDPGVAEDLDPSPALTAGARDGPGHGKGLPCLYGLAARTVAAGALQTVKGLVTLPARQTLDVGEPLFDGLVDAQDGQVGRCHHDPVLDTIDDRGEETLLAAYDGVRLPEGLFPVLPLDGGPEDLRERAQGGDLVVVPPDVPRVVREGDKTPPASSRQDRDHGDRDLPVELQFVHGLLREAPDGAVDGAALAPGVDPLREAEGHLRVAQEPLPGACSPGFGGEPLVAAEHGDPAPLIDPVLAEEGVGGVHGGAEALKDPLDPVPPAGTLQKRLGGIGEGLENGGPFFQDVLGVLPERDVPSDGLVLQDVAAVVEKGPVGPLVPEDVAEDVLDPVFQRIGGALRPEFLQAGIDLLAVRLRDGEQDVSAPQVLPLAAEIPAVGLVDVGEGAVGPEPADEFRLVRLPRRAGLAVAGGAVRPRADLVERPLGEDGVSGIVLDVLDDAVEPADTPVLVENRAVALRRGTDVRPGRDARGNALLFSPLRGRPGAFPRAARRGRAVPGPVGRAGPAKLPLCFDKPLDQVFLRQPVILKCAHCFPPFPLKTCGNPMVVMQKSNRIRRNGTIFRGRRRHAGRERRAGSDSRRVAAGCTATPRFGKSCLREKAGNGRAGGNHNTGAGTRPRLLRYRLGENGGDEGDRTPNLRIANAALSQLSYIPTSGTTA